MTDFKIININKITDYIASGCKSYKAEKIGVECEHIITDKYNNPVSYYGDKGVEKILILLSDNYSNKTFSDGHLVGLDDGKVFITLEPAAQVEVSIIPLDDINEIKSLYLDFVNKFESVISLLGYKLNNVGYHPVSKADDLELIPKERYRLMDSYFISKGYKPRFMMRGSASVQVNIDYFSEEDFALKFRLANILTPLFYLITDNTDIFEGEKFIGFSARSYAWENVDNSRCGFLDFSTFQEYASWLYSTQPIFINENGKEVDCGLLSNEEIFYSQEISSDDIKHIMSMVFPNVRVKQFIEIRAGDSMPVEFMLAYSCLIKGLFYNHNALIDLNRKFEKVNCTDLYEQVSFIRQKGFKCEYLSYDLKDLLIMIFNYSEANLTQEERLILKPLKDSSLAFKTPKDFIKHEVTL